MRWSAFLLVPVLLACEAAEGPDTPAPAVAPQAITYSDIEANDLHGAGCAYASGNSMAPIAIAFADEAVMKIDGGIRRFRIDAESEGAERMTAGRYLAEDRVLHLATEGPGTRAGEEMANFTGTVRLVDGAGAVLFETTGTAQCGS